MLARGDGVPIGVTIAATAERVATLEHAPIAEQSGIVRSPRHEGVYWVLNDSGAGPALFPIRLDGSVVAPDQLASRHAFGREADRRGRPAWPGLLLEGASNRDWEDLTTDGERLFVADTGNNGNARRDLGVYVLPEPDPASVARARPVAFWPIAYPTQTAFPPEERRYDCEAVFWHAGHLYFVTKHRKGRDLPDVSADLYRLDDPRTDGPNVLVHVDRADDLGGWVTAAALSPDGRRLAVLVQGGESAVWLFPTPAQGDAFFSGAGGAPARLGLGDLAQVEGLTWASDDRILVTNEQRAIFRVPAPPP